jgi:hypothetical protein
MTRKNKKPLVERVHEAAEAALARQKYVSLIDVLGGIRWLDGGAVHRWRLGQIDCIEETIQAHPASLAEAKELFISWAAGRGLAPSEVQYVARTPHRQVLRFTRSADANAEQLYRIHWVSPKLPEHKRERLVEKANQPPELVVISPLNDDWTCHRCGGTGDLLIMEKPGPACLRCAGLDDLEFLPAGDALLTRRVHAASARHAVVVRFSKTRRRYERQGLLVEAQTLAQTQRQLEEDRRT